ncbi:MAG: NAD(+) diphosphatase [Proteobacteria bacterium]|nr:NAD(+) diphosphatase [Pseudomonadota bacterium]
MDRPNYYAGLDLDRLAERRRDAAWLEQRLAAAATRIVPVWQAMSLVIDGEAPTAMFLTHQDLVAVEAPRIFLGEADGAAYFAIDLSALPETELPGLVNGRGSFLDLRAIGSRLAWQQAGMLALARGLVHWHARHRYCGVCGAPTRSASAGHTRECINTACAAQHFPRTDPAVIMLVTHGDQCLLGRQSRWPKGQHSTLAGFVEPGESLEEAVAREVWEEAGVRVKAVRYQSSQPWPFPASIMLGFRAEAVSLDYRVDRDELEDAKWFTRDFLRQSHEPETFRLPRVDSIARRLVEDWLAEG